MLADRAGDVGTLLRKASERVASSTTDDGVEMRRHIGLLARAVDQASGGMAPNLGTLPSYAPARRLLDALRSQLLDLATQPPHLPMIDLLNTLRGIETVQGALDADAAQRLATKVSSPNALEAVVAVAHDMRSPLTSVLFLVDALRKGQSGPVVAHQDILRSG